MGRSSEIAPERAGLAGAGKARGAAARWYGRGETGPHRLTVRTPVFQAGSRGSIPRGGVGGVGRRREDSAGVAQLVERLLAMQKVAGSSPVARSERRTDCPGARWEASGAQGSGL